MPGEIEPETVCEQTERACALHKGAKNEKLKTKSHNEKLINWKNDISEI